MLESQSAAALLQPNKTVGKLIENGMPHRRRPALVKVVVATATMIGSLIATACSSPEPDQAGPSEATKPSNAPSAPIPGATRTPKPEPSEPATQPRPRELATTTTGPQVTLSLMGRYKDPLFGAAGLPAVSVDGSLVAYAVELEDGGRGHPNFRLVVRRVNDSRIVFDFVILDPNKPWNPEDELVVRGRVANANERLAKNQWRELAPLVEVSEPLGASTEAGDDGNASFANETTTAVIRGGRLRFTRKGKLLGTAVVAKLISNNSTCVGVVRLADVRVGAGLALVRLRFEAEGCIRDSEIRLIRFR